MDKDKESVAIKLYRCRETLASIMDGWYRSHYEDEDHAKLFGYTLKVVEVTESKVVTKILELNHPWVKIRKGDKINP